MRYVKKTLFKGSTCLPLIAVVLSGCATVETGHVINPGDMVAVRFTCRLPNGDIAVTSENSVAVDPKLAKSPIFIKRAAEDLLEIQAGGDPKYPSKQVTSFEEDAMQGIAVKLPGLKTGEIYKIDLASSGSANGQMKLSRVRHASKEKKVLVEDYRKHTGKEPEKGQTVFMDEELPGTVMEIADSTVTITFSAAEGTVVQTPLGPGKVRDAGSQYDIVIDAKQGDLKRMGPWAGRVRSADEREMDLDFSKTFGGENLSCDVTADTAKPAAQQAAAEPAPAASTPAASATPPVETKAAQGDAVSATTEKKDPPSQEEIMRKGEVLNRAIAEGMKKGETSMSIDADLLFAPAERGDLVTVRFAAREPGGVPLSLPAEMAAQDIPQELIAGNQEVFPGVGEAVIGMSAGDLKKLTVPPEKAFGTRTPENNAFFPLENTMPRKITITADEYVKRFGGFPAVGKEVPLVPNLTSKVTNIGDKDVTLEISATDGARFDEQYGTVTVAVGKESITMKLAPKLGAQFSAGERQGVITASDGKNFTVDFNHPLAGKTIEVDMEVLSITKAATLKAKPVTWIENHDAGLAEARKEEKPAVLVLYADWCGFCKKLFSESVTDPRVAGLKDSFVWVKVNSEKEQKYGNLYGQSGFPMIVILSGTVAEKIDGFRDGAALSKVLKEFLNGKKG